MKSRWWIALVAIYLLVVTQLMMITADATEVAVLPVVGSLRVQAVYCLATLPLTWIASLYLTASWRMKTGLGCAALSCLLAWLLPQVASFLSQQQADGVQRDIARSIIAFLLTLPVGSLLATVTAKNELSSHQLRKSSEIGLAIIGAALLPALYVRVQIQGLRQASLEQHGKGRVAAELKTLSYFWELHGDDRVGQQRVSTSLRELKREYRKLVAEVSQPLPTTVDANAIQQRAMQLLSIDRPIEAESTLATLTDNQSTLLLKAITARELKRWDKVQELSLALIQESPDDRLPHELLGEAFHAQRKFDEAIAAYEHVLAAGGSQPAVADALIHVRIAKVYMDRGNRASALQHFNMARQLAPALQAESLTYQRSILQSSCSLRQ